MKYLIISLGLILSLAACNMTAGSSNGRDSETVALAAQATSTPQPTISTQANVPTQTPLPVQNASVQNNVVSQSNSPVQNNHPVQNNVATVSPSCTIAADWPVYIVVAGDTLSRIAQLGTTTVENLKTANCLNDINALEVGQQIRVPMSLDSVVDTATNLRRLGDFNGATDLSGCWANRRGDLGPVYDVINGQPIGTLTNRIPVLSVTSDGWVAVSVLGTKTIPDTTGWMRLDQVSIVGACIGISGVPSGGERGQVFGNPGPVPDGVCAVVATAPNFTDISNEMAGTIFFGTMSGWARLVTTQGHYYQVEFTLAYDIPLLGWVRIEGTELVNC